MSTTLNQTINWENFQDKKYFIKNFIKLIKAHDVIIIFHHVNPDGDCLGSQFGLKYWLKKIYPEKQILTVGDQQNLFNFLEWNFDAVDQNLLANALAIVVDANYKNRIEKLEILEQIKTKVRIDHHPENDDLDYQLRWVDPSYCASAEQISDLIYSYKPKTIDQQIAIYLYLGIYTDSGRFFYDKTSSRTHQLSAWLIASGFNMDAIHQALAKKTIQDLQLQQEVYAHYQTKQNVIYYFMTQSKMKQLNLSLAQANRVDLLANIEGYSVWIFFIENEDQTIRVRLRSNQKDVNSLAKIYGGGGHIRASGAIINDQSLIDEVVEKATML